ncbi:MAG: (Na+)-NQR maturation NqrM [Methylovulum sp.]|nr:(Na+)-NQR maturation NqrM [Methylovulum sp.]MCF7999826.1 (Na+)-NQR maturation NqrM [Methylovulum sp.]
MNLFLITFAIMLVVVGLMAIGVIFGRRAIKGSCGGINNSDCVCVEKCDKRKKLEAEDRV